MNMMRRKLHRPIIKIKGHNLLRSCTYWLYSGLFCIVIFIKSCNNVPQIETTTLSPREGNMRTAIIEHTRELPRTDEGIGRCARRECR